jgi:DNA-binding transcriptional MerR regulator
MPTPTTHPNAKVTLPVIPPKRYFSIGEVAELCSLKPHVLRYWEQEFTQLRPMKRSGNRRYYQHHEVLLVRRIRELLYEEGFTISGARNRLIEKGSKAKLNADLIAQASADAALVGVAFPPDLFAPLELGSEAASYAWSVASSEDLAEAQAEAEADDMVIGSYPRKLAPRSLPIASGLDLVKIRRELNAALDLLNFDGLP